MCLDCIRAYAASSPRVRNILDPCACGNHNVGTVAGRNGSDGLGDTEHHGRTGCHAGEWTEIDHDGAVRRIGDL